MFVRKLDTKRSHTHDSLTAGYRALWIVLLSTQEAVMALACNSHAPNRRLQNLMMAGLYPAAAQPGSLVGRRNVGCKLTAAVYLQPISCQISRYSATKSSKTIPSLGPIFAPTPSAVQAPSKRPVENMGEYTGLNPHRPKPSLALRRPRSTPVVIC